MTTTTGSKAPSPDGWGERRAIRRANARSGSETAVSFGTPWSAVTRGRVLGALLLALIASAVLASSAQDDAAVSLSLRIVPTSFTGTGARAITLIDPSQHFAVVLTNVGKSPVRVWRETCSWGYSNLSFEVQDQDGSLVTVTRRQRPWEKNFQDWMVLPPGDHLVFDVTFDATTWQHAPLPEPGRQRTVGLRAVYESADGKEARANKVWSGKVVSPQNPYTLFR